jgi:signal transduction histidine kinase
VPSDQGQAGPRVVGGSHFGQDHLLTADRQHGTGPAVTTAGPVAAPVATAGHQQRRADRRRQPQPDEQLRSPAETRLPRRSVRSVLAAADVTVTIRQHHNPLPPHTSTTLATILREGVTNLLRHSKAEHCDIALTQHHNTITLHIENDGLPTTPIPHHTPGDGITNLTARVADLGGHLTANPTAHHTYQLHADIPWTPTRQVESNANLRTTSGPEPS